MESQVEWEAQQRAVLTNKLNIVLPIIVIGVVLAIVFGLPTLGMISLIYIIPPIILLFILLVIDYKEKRKKKK